MLALKGQQQEDGKPPAMITRMVKGVKCNYSYLRTVNTLQELDDFRFEHQCKCSNMRRTFATFKIVQMRCTNTDCPFALLAWRPGPEPDQICVYANSSKHNHVVMPAGQLQEQYLQNGGKPPAMIKRMLKGVEYGYNYLKTVHSFQELDDIRFGLQCSTVNMNERIFASFESSVQLRCQKAKPVEKGSCPFTLLVWCPEPAADKKQTHVYASRCEHNHAVMPADERLVQRREIWSDEKEAPRNFRTLNGREWTYLESTEPENNLIKQLLEKLQRKYHCAHRGIKDMGKTRTTVCRVTLYCTSNGATTNSKCKFQMLVQRTDTGRYHLYTSRAHTCSHRNKVIITRKKPLTKCNRQQEEEKDKENAEKVEAAQEMMSQEDDEQVFAEEELEKEEEEEEDIVFQEMEEEKSNDDDEEDKKEEEHGEMEEAQQEEEIEKCEENVNEEVREDEEEVNEEDKQEELGEEGVEGEEEAKTEVKEEENEKHQPFLIFNGHSCRGRAARKVEATTKNNAREDEEMEAKIEQMFMAFAEEGQQVSEEQEMTIANNDTSVPAAAIKKRKRNLDANIKEEDGDAQFNVDFVANPKFDVKIRRLDQPNKKPEAVNTIITLDED